MSDTFTIYTKFTDGSEGLIQGMDKPTIVSVVTTTLDSVVPIFSLEIFPDEE